MNHGLTRQQQIDDIDRLLKEELIDCGVVCVLLIDLAGNIVSTSDNGENSYDFPAFAALAAGNFSSIDAMAKMVGEKEFSQLYHKGEQVNIQISRVNEELLLLTLFGQDLSLGFLRLKVADAIARINRICQP